MSYFSTALTRITDRNQLRQADVVRDSGLTRSHLSRLFSGEQRTITDEDLIALLKAFRDKRDQAEIIAARCMDVRVGPAAGLVEIGIKAASAGPRAGKQNEFPEVELSHETERAFAWLRSQCPLNPDLEKHLVGYAKLTGMK
jgi:transcriptional regulator with XRE-family HTH domain